MINKVNLYESIVEQDNPLYPIDYFDVYLSMYALITALQKVASCYDNKLCNFNFVEKDIDQIFDTLEKTTDQFNNLQMRNAFRD